MPKHVIWAVVADAGRLRILERTMASKPWHKLEAEATEHANPSSHEIGTDRPGRTHESVGLARHAIEPRHDPHKAAEAAFASGIAARLESAAVKGRYNHLLLIAPPVFLGELRRALGKETQRRLSCTFDIDLTRARTGEIVERLGKAGSLGR